MLTQTQQVRALVTLGQFLVALDTLCQLQQEVWSVMEVVSGPINPLVIQTPAIPDRQYLTLPVWIQIQRLRALAILGLYHVIVASPSQLELEVWSVMVQDPGIINPLVMLIYAPGVRRFLMQPVLIQTHRLFWSGLVSPGLYHATLDILCQLEQAT